MSSESTPSFESPSRETDSFAEFEYLQRRSEAKETLLKAPAIVYYEDATFQRIVHRYDRALCRAWRVKLEQLYGSYNADLTHRCSTACLMPSPSAFSNYISSNKSSDIDMSLEYIHTIDSRRRIYGCPRSGHIHQCAERSQERVLTCLFDPAHPERSYLPMESDTGGIICQYSGSEIHESGLVYEPRNESQEHICYDPIEQSVRQRRSNQVTEQTDKMDDQTKQVVTIVMQEAMSGKYGDRESTAILDELRRGLLRMNLEKGKRKFTKRKRSNGDLMSSDESSATDGSDTSSSSSRTVSPSGDPSCGSGGDLHPFKIQAVTRSLSASREVVLVDDQRLVSSDYKRIQTAVEEILFDPYVSTDWRRYSPVHTTPFPKALGNICGLGADKWPLPTTEKLRDFYTIRCALIFVIYRKRAEALRERKRKSVSKRPTSRQRYDFALITVAALRMLCTGISRCDDLSDILGTHAINITEPDLRLSKAMPLPSQLPYYGLQSGLRRQIMPTVDDMDHHDSLKMILRYREDSKCSAAVQESVKLCEFSADYLRKIFVAATVHLTAYSSNSLTSHLATDHRPIPVDKLESM